MDFSGQPRATQSIARFATLLAAAGLCWNAFPADQRSLDSDYDWFSLPIEVSALPKENEFTPVSLRIDFSDCLRRLGVAGAVDERSLRLYRVARNGKRSEEPLQWLAALQSRPLERRALPGTPPSVSYLAEYAAGETPEHIRVEGDLVWIAGKPQNGAARYQLYFGVPKAGRMIQVPFPPQNLRGFDGRGQARRVRWFPRMQIRPQWPVDGAIQVFENQDLVTTYHHGPRSGQGDPAQPLRRPFLYPVNGPDGISLTEFGKPHDPTGSHAHHYSLWIAHANVNGKDFWSEKGGIIAHEQFELLEDGPLFCRWTQRARWVFDGVSLLRDRRQFTVYRAGNGFRIMDLELELTPAGAGPVTFGQTSFGFLAARVAQSMTVFDGGGEIMNARGDINEHGAHQKRARWIDQSGPVAEGIWNGLTLFDHPDNPNHPTGWHCRNDGWAGAAFNLESPHTLAPGQTLRLRYRILLHRGNALEGQVERRFTEFAAKPEARLGKPSAGR